MTPTEKREYCFMFMFMFTMCFSTLLICHYLADLSISLQSVSTINLTREINGLNENLEILDQFSDINIKKDIDLLNQNFKLLHSFETQLVSINNIINQDFSQYIPYLDSIRGIETQLVSINNRVNQDFSQDFDMMWKNWNNTISLLQNILYRSNRYETEIINNQPDTIEVSETESVSNPEFNIPNL